MVPSFSLSFTKLKMCVISIFILNQREIHSSKSKQYVIDCISLGWLCIFMLLHKQIERLKINMYIWLPHFQLALVIDHHHRIIIGIVNAIWQFKIRWKQGVPNQKNCDICCIIMYHAHVQFQIHCFFDEYGFI